jgi:aminomethyltransferase
VITLKRTALFDAHQKLGARLIDFGGWEMPVQYTSIVEEHLAVRNAAGIFDISHMGEVTVSGAG